jgi:hypothetical protein
VNDKVELLLRGLKPWFNRSDRELLETVAKYIKLGGVFMSYENKKPVGFAIVLWPEDAIEKPQVAHFYSEGSRSSTRKLISHVLDRVRQKGYNTLLTVNNSGARDDIWSRAFRHKDWEMQPVKTVFEMKVKQNG